MLAIWAVKVLMAVVILALAFWASRSKYLEWRALRYRFGGFWNTITPLDPGVGFTYQREWYGGARSGRLVHGVDVRHVIPSRRKAKLAAKYYFKAIEAGKVEMQTFETWSELVQFVHFTVVPIYASRIVL